MKRFVGVFVKYYKASDRGFLGLANLAWDSVQTDIWADAINLGTVLHTPNLVNSQSTESQG